MNLVAESPAATASTKRISADFAGGPVAVTVTAPGTVALEPLAPPFPLRSDEVRGRTVCSLVSPGTELAWNYHGKEFPNHPGYAALFEVEEKGADVADRAVGELLFCQGGHRSGQQVRAADTVKVPVGLVPAEAVVARLLGVSMTTLMTTRARPGDLVLITGMGPVGYCAACNFAAAGYRVHAVEPNDDRRARIANRCRTTIHPRVPLGDGALQGKVALVVECSGHEQAVIDGASIVRTGGEVVLVGVPWQRRTDRYLHDLLHIVFHRYVTIRSGWEWEIPTHESEGAPHSIMSGFALALQWLKEGKIPLDGLIEQVDPRAAQRVYDDYAGGSPKNLFTVFDWARLESRPPST